jgi:uncharacterized radical SAM superfamily protein
MNHFSLIQKFFTRMTCPHCGSHIHERGVELVREMNGLFLVSVTCSHCGQHVGMAMVGVDREEASSSSSQQGNAMGMPSPDVLQRQGLLKRRYKDPELTPHERKRLSAFAPIGFDDVLDVHHTLDTLGTDWHKRIPPDVLQRVQRDLQPKALDEADEHASTLLPLSSPEAIRLLPPLAP